MSKEECCTCSDRLNYIKLCEKYDQLESIHEVLVEDNLTYENQIADLEAKLAESEKNFVVANNLRKNSDEVLLNYKTEKYGLEKTIQELRKIKLSLPEKEWYYKGFENCERQMSSHIADLTLEVKELKQQLAEKDRELYLTKDTLEHHINIYNSLFESRAQDKISFALEQLEKVKEFNIQQVFSSKPLDNFIDNQIKQLKEGK